MDCPKAEPEAKPEAEVGPKAEPEAKPVEAKPVEAKPVEAKPVEAAEAAEAAEASSGRSRSAESWEGVGEGACGAAGEGVRVKSQENLEFWETCRSGSLENWTSKVSESPCTG